MPERVVGLGIIGAGLMGRELASAVARWVHLDDLGVRPRLVHVADIDASMLSWYRRLDSPPRGSTDYHELLADQAVDAVYCAVPHHLHERILIDVLHAGKHLLGEKPFGVDLKAAEAIMTEARSVLDSWFGSRRSCRSTLAAKRYGAGSPSVRLAGSSTCG